MALVGDDLVGLEGDIQGIWSKAEAVWQDRYADQFQQNKMKPMLELIEEAREQTERFYQLLERYKNRR